MTQRIDFDRLTDDWLADGPTKIPDRALQAALDEVHVTNQRRFGAARRTFALNPKIYRLAAAALLVVVVVGAGLFVLGRLPGGAVGGPPTPSPSPSPLPTPTPISFVPLPQPANLAPGTYVTVSPFDLSGITFTVADGWSQSDLGPKMAGIGRVNAARTQSEVYITFELPQVVYADPCNGDTPFSPATGPTIDNFIADLRRMPHFTVGPTSSITLGGLPATAFDFTNDIPFDGTGCALGDTPLIQEWDTGNTQGGYRQHLILADVNGTRLLVDVLYTNPQATTDQTVQSVLDSIRFP